MTSFFRFCSSLLSSSKFCIINLHYQLNGSSIVFCFYCLLKKQTVLVDRTDLTVELMVRLSSVVCPSRMCCDYALGLREKKIY